MAALKTEKLLRDDTIPRESPYYCFEFVAYDTKKSFNLFYETFFPNLSRLFALGLSRSMFFTNASKQPLDMKYPIIEKRFWWDFNYDKMERCGGRSELTFGGGKRIGNFKLAESTIDAFKVESLVPGLKGLAITSCERVYLFLKSLDKGTLGLSTREVLHSARSLLNHPNCLGCALYSRVEDFEPDHQGEADVFCVLEVLFSKEGIVGSGKAIMESKEKFRRSGIKISWGVFKEERFLPLDYQYDMRYPSIIGRLHGF